KRMFHNMAPLVLLSPGGRPYAAVGLPGGPKIVTVTAQLVVSLVDFKVPPTVAVSAPRIHIEANEPIAVSAAVPEPVIEQLRALGDTQNQGVAHDRFELLAQLRCGEDDPLCDRVNLDGRCSQRRDCSPIGCQLLNLTVVTPQTRCQPSRRPAETIHRLDGH